MALIKLNDETIGYSGAKVIQNVTLEIEVGERIALVGESGAGKSTLLNFIHMQLGKTAALVPQELGLAQALSVFHNVYIGRLHQNSVWRNIRNLFMPTKADVELITPILLHLRLEDKIFTNVGELSGGQQQRTAVGRAIFHPSDVLVADEPVSSVDEHQAREILERIDANKKTVILAMHDRSLAIEFADRLIGIKNGKIILDAPSNGMLPCDLDHLYQKVTH